MDKNAIKKYAIWAREELIKRVSTKAVEYEIRANAEIVDNIETIGDRVLTATEKKQRTALINIVKDKGFEQAMEEAAYTWFNRFIALRFMEVNGYLPSRVRVFTDEENNFKPQILDEAIHMELDGLDLEKVLDLKEQNKKDELYKYLIITQCNALHSVLPKMFPKIDDYTQLLFPDNILRDGSAIEQMIAIIPEEDFKDAVEIIGWAYQYYNEERKNEVINIYKGTVSKNDIPAATQLFTTDWVVRYMVDNSLGKYWIERNPNSKLAEKLKYYVAPKNGQISYINEKVTPEEMTFFDPCMGSGHILVYAFDVLMEIYTECGYTERDAVASITQNNIFGLDIDDRAYQLAYFALMMKARSKDRRFLTREIEPQVYCPHDNDELQNFGSIFIVGELGAEPTEPAELTLFNQDWQKELDNWNFKRLLTQKYAVVCTNPPYLNKYNPTLKKYVTDNYKDYNGDLFSVFIYKNFDYCKPNGYSAFMTPFVWMFIKTYEKLREYIINNKSITSLIQMEYSAFEEATVPICSFVLKNGKENEKGLYFKLSDFKGGMEVQKQKVIEALADKECGYFYETSEENFSKIPGSPIAYWVSEDLRNTFIHSKLLSAFGSAKVGLQTGDTNQFLRNWSEVVYSNISLSRENNSMDYKWYPICKGGDFRKWYGNNDYIVNWENDGYEIRNFKDESGRLKSRPQNVDFYFKKGLTWNLISSANFAVRYFPAGMIFDVSANSFFCNDEYLNYIAAVLNSKVCFTISKILNPTINFSAGVISNLPIAIKEDIADSISEITHENISLSKIDWDSFETSWDFVRHPLI